MTPTPESPALNPRKVGIVIRCAICSRMKQPRGRSAPLGASYCNHHECAGYQHDPQVGSLWPGESEADFGFPVSDVGTEILAEQARETTPEAPMLTADDLRAAVNACGAQGNIHDNAERMETGISRATRGAEWHALADKLVRASDALRAASPAGPVHWVEAWDDKAGAFVNAIDDPPAPNDRLKAIASSPMASRLQSHLVSRRQQHTDALKGWQEPDGFLVATEPDADERRRVRDCLHAALSELSRIEDVLGRAASSAGPVEKVQAETTPEAPMPDPHLVVERREHGVECDLCSGISAGVVVRDPRPAHALTFAEFCDSCWQRLMALRAASPAGPPSDVQAKYQELIYAVARKFPDESRHETALRYIRQAEAGDNDPAKAIAASPAGRSGDRT